MKMTLKTKLLDCIFSANWCPACSGFKQYLIDVYENLKKAKKDFEVILVSSDRNTSEFKSYFASTPFKRAVLVMEWIPNANEVLSGSAESHVPVTRYVVALTLAEAETVRRMVHAYPQMLGACAIALRIIDGSIIDCSSNFVEEKVDKEHFRLVDQALPCLKLYN